MIIFGTSKERVKYQEPLHFGNCPHCNQQNRLTAFVMMRYAHVWYLPVFPLGKRVIASCDHCKATYNLKGLPQNIAQQCMEVKQKAKTPLKYWTLLIIAGILFVAALLLAL